jgi:hypothetical protein
MGGLCLSEGFVPVLEPGFIHNKNGWRDHGRKKY